MNELRSTTHRVLWLPVGLLVLLLAVWFLGAGRQNPASADEPQKLYLSSSAGLTINGIRYADEDILVLDTSTGQWQLFFDGSTFGLAALDIDALEILPDGALLLSLDQYTTAVPGVSEVSDADILRFQPSSPGNYGAGTFSMYVDGSDIGLTTNGEDIDAIALAPNGDLLISTFSTAKVPMGAEMLTGRDTDMMRLDLTQTGGDTDGTWSLYFDGSDVRLTTLAEDIRGAWLDPATGDLFLSTFKNFNVGPLTGTGSDIFVCQALTSGNNTSCTFGASLFWDGSASGFGSNLIDALAISGDIVVPPTPPPGATSTPTATPPPGTTSTPTATPPPASPTPPPASPTATPTATPGSGNPPSTEMLIYDWNKPVTVREKGMPRDRPPMASANGDWTQPRNLAEGTLHFRVEIFGMPVTKRMQTQFCVWQDDWAREQCADRSNVFVGARGTVVTWSEPIATMWKLPGSIPIDWSRERMIWGYVIRTEDGGPVHPKFNWSGQNTDEWFPLDWRATAVVVQKGATFSGWNNHIP